MLQSRSALAVSVAGRTVSHDTGLSPQHEQFAGLLAIGTNQSEAYRQVFPRSREWLPKTVHEKASALAAEGKVQARVQELMAGAAAANEVGVGMVLNSYLARLRADPRELSEIWVGPCRYCRGTDHLYQFTDGELRRAKAKHEERRLLRIENGKGDIGEFDEQGGGGFNITLAPCTACPNCGGAGVARSVLKDSRNYSADALALFVSAHEGKEGIKVNVNDRDAALQQIARYVGFFEADKDPAATVTFNIAEADALYERALAKSAADAAHAKGRMARLRAAGIDVDGDAVDATLIGGDDE